MPSTKTNRNQLAKAKRNKRVRTYTRSRIALARSEIEDDPTSEETQLATAEALKALDQASSKGIIHKRNAARRKSRLMAQLNKATATTTEE